MLLVCLVFNQLVTHAFETVLEPPAEHLRARPRIPESKPCPCLFLVVD